jgi:hypothetical protein
MNSNKGIKGFTRRPVTLPSMGARGRTMADVSCECTAQG